MQRYEAAINTAVIHCTSLPGALNPRSDETVLKAFTDVTNGILFVAMNDDTLPADAWIKVRDLITEKRKSLAEFLQCL